MNNTLLADIDIRPLSIFYFERIWENLNEAHVSHYFFCGNKPLKSTFYKELSNSLGWVALYQNRFVGLVQIYFNQLSYFVCHDYQGKGIGRVIVSQVHNLMTDRADIRELKAVIIRDNIPSVKVIENIGYQLDRVYYSNALRQTLLHYHFDYSSMAFRS